jgi:hypothetical protein
MSLWLKEIVDIQFHECLTLALQKGERLITNNSVALVRQRTIQTERQPLVEEVSAKFC